MARSQEDVLSWRSLPEFLEKRSQRDIFQEKRLGANGYSSLCQAGDSKSGYNLVNESGTSEGPQGWMYAQSGDESFEGPGGESEERKNIRRKNIRMSTRTGRCVNVSEEIVSARLGTVKLLEIMGGMEFAGTCGVEKDSVYGAAVAIPQIARSGGWSKSMFCLTLRAYLFVCINYVVQAAFVYYIYDSLAFMNAYGGQMHLCDFAAHIDRCPDAPNCRGPGGKEIPDPGSLYLFDIWYTRKFVQESLQTLFPERRDEIAANIDPGEYGVESYYCRWLCVFVFVLGILDEFHNMCGLIKLLYRLPSEDAAWIQYVPPTSDPSAGDVGELAYVRFLVNGMPLRWKVGNAIFLLVPRIFIFRMLTMAGVNFLMETSAMADQIVNTTALAFVLTMDELILEHLTTRTTRYIMANLEDYELFDYSDNKGESDEAALERYNTHELHWFSDRIPSWLFPHRLFWCLLLMSACVAEYYWHACKRSEDGSWVSKDVHLPHQAHLNIWTFAAKFFTIHQEHEGAEVWRMP